MLSLEDFKRGFQDFLGRSVESSNRGSVGQQKDEEETSVKRKHQQLCRQSSAQRAWLHFSNRLGHDNIRLFLSNSAERLYGLYEELHMTPEAPPQLVAQFESLMESLVTDARHLEAEREKFDQALRREREQHQIHIKSLEEELDAQVLYILNEITKDLLINYKSSN